MVKQRCLITGVAIVLGWAFLGRAEDVLELGRRLEPLVDDYLIDSMEGARLTLHRPTARQVAIVHDAPWEGDTCCYHTVFRDGDVVRMYYRGAESVPRQGDQVHPELVCYAESTDGIHFTKPELGLFEFAGSKKNNIVWMGIGSHDFAPMRDANPNCPADAKYKALARGGGGLVAFESADAIHWSLISEKAVITEGAFDSQNLAFWDSTRNRYVDFHRGFHEGVRAIMTCTSADFANWTDPVWLEFPGAPLEHLYTNQITPYYRAPHVFLGFPKRFVPSRNPTGSSHGGVSDGVFMTSRDGLKFHRWGEAIIRPGLQRERWVTRNNMTAWGIVVTQSDLPGTPEELSIYSTEGYYQGVACRLRRFTWRIDGFVSVRAPLSGGQFTTKPLRFAPSDEQPGTTELIINYSTSAAGSLRCELLDAEGKPVSGYTLKECDEVFGDQIERAVSWQGETNVGRLGAAPIRLRVVLSDADLYSIRFR